jgi:uncharacterized membrane protein YphA (DoxX/SURF4 family)/thiol-disulfide isomerase/thioredoxin
MGILPLVFRCLLAGVFVVAGVGKLLDLAGSGRAMEEFGLPARLARVVGVLLPLVELAAAAALFVNASARYGGIAALLLLLVFVAGLTRAVAQGRTPDCHCFGQIRLERAGPTTIARNVILAALAVVVVAAGGGGSFPSQFGELDGTHIALALATVAAVLLALVTAQLWGERRRLTGELQAAQAAARKHGLARGSQAPEFTLVPVRGEARSLADLLQTERPVVLAFLSTNCGPCVELLPELARWQVSLSDSLTLATIFSGDRAEVERLADEHSLITALAQEQNEIFDLYALRATPSAVEISASGAIVNVPAEGPPAIEALVRAVLARAQPQRLIVAQG